VAAYPAPTRSNQAIGQRRFLSPKTVEATPGPRSKLGPDVGPNDNRRVLAVLAFLRS
jgi:hypothetical protein